MNDAPTAPDEVDDQISVSHDLTAQLVKKLVRYALACEYSRQQIRREGIRERGRRSDPVAQSERQGLTAVYP